MQPNSIDGDVLKKLNYLVGNADVIRNITDVPALTAFDDVVVEFLDTLSKSLMTSKAAKEYPDVVTLGFWIRKSSVLRLRSRFLKETDDIMLGRGIAFHIAPSNVPVNYAYSLITGLLTGNANIVRIPSKDFPQVSIINNAINEVLGSFSEMRPYICLVRYERNQDINDDLSKLADTRIIWGGDSTISELRKSPLSPRACEITFADRYSLAVIDSDKYLALDEKEGFAQKFYNDTYLSDQNACTSPRIVVWTGSKKAKAKDVFWKTLHDLVKKKYEFQPIMGINKLTSSYLAAVAEDDVKVEIGDDNYIFRINVKQASPALMELKDNSGYFFEYDCEGILEIKEFCNNTHCQTIGYLGEKEDITRLLTSGIKGVDRVVPIGSTMDFDLIWDGYNLVERLTRTIKVNL